MRKIFDMDHDCKVFSNYECEKGRNPIQGNYTPKISINRQVLTKFGQNAQKLFQNYHHCSLNEI